MLQEGFPQIMEAFILTSSFSSWKAAIKSLEGEPPLQFKDFEETENVTTSVDTDESFFGDENYDIDEIDKSGFEGFENTSSDIESSDLL